MVVADRRGVAQDAAPVGKTDWRDVDGVTLRRLVLAMFYGEGVPVEALADAFRCDRRTVWYDLRQTPVDAGERLLGLFK